MKTRTQSASPPEKLGPLITWSLQGRTYVAVRATASRGLDDLDEDRANSMTDEGGSPGTGLGGVNGRHDRP